MVELAKTTQPDVLIRCIEEFQRWQPEVQNAMLKFFNKAAIERTKHPPLPRSEMWWDECVRRLGNEFARKIDPSFGRRNHNEQTAAQREIFEKMIANRSAEELQEVKTYLLQAAGR